MEERKNAKTEQNTNEQNTQNDNKNARNTKNAKKTVCRQNTGTIPKIPLAVRRMIGKRGICYEIIQN